MKTQGGSDAKVALIGCMGAIIAAIIGLGTPVVDRLLDRLIPPPATVIVAPPTIAPTSLVEEIVQRPAPPTPTFALELPTQTSDSSPSPPVPDDPSDNVAFDPPTTTQVTPELHQGIVNFLAYANEVEIYTRFTGDMSYAADTFADDWLAALENDIASLRNEGLVQLSYFDGPNSAIQHISIVDDYTIQADTCEIWSTTYYRLADYSVADYRPAELLPQTITLEYIDDSWLITHVEHYTAPHFCQ